MEVKRLRECMAGREESDGDLETEKCLRCVSLTVDLGLVPPSACFA